MQRYLLFDSGCSLCTSLARQVEEVAGGTLTARSLRDPAVRSILDEVKPGWRWQPMLLEVDGERRRVYAAIGRHSTGCVHSSSGYGLSAHRDAREPGVVQ